MPLFWTNEAIADRETIYDYIEADNPQAALALDELFTEQAEHLLAHPDLGRPGRVAATREWVVHQLMCWFTMPAQPMCAYSEYYIHNYAGLAQVADNRSVCLIAAGW